MDSSADDAERLRRRREAADRAATRPPGGAIPDRTRVGQVSGTGGGDAAGRFYEVTAMDVLGAEVEGGDGDLVDAGYAFLALNLGTEAPIVDETVVICTYVDFRWVFRWDGSA